MKYTALFVLSVSFSLQAVSQRPQTHHIYSLHNGGVVEIPPLMYDTLFSRITFNKKDSTATQIVDVTSIYNFYYTKRDSVFKKIVNLPVFDFEAKDTEGFSQNTSSYRGRVLILHFWLFWSSSFDKEIPILNTLTDKYAKDGLAILSLTSLPVNDAEKQKLKEQPLNFPLIENAFNFTNDFFKMSLIRPCLIVVDKMGNMRYLYDGVSYNKALATKDSEGVSEFERCIQDLLK